MDFLNGSKEAVKQFSDKYSEAKKAHPSLPTLEELDREFDILETVSRERHFPRNIIRYTRWYVIRAINGWAGYLHEFILPNPHNAMAMEEYNYFNEDEKKEVISLLNWIMYYVRESHLLQLYEDDSKSAEFTSRVFNEWIIKKKSLFSLAKKNAEIWKGKITDSK